MGRTNPTYRDALRVVEDRWAEYRRALRNRDQPRFDRLLAYAREHADASGLLNHRNPLLPALFSIDLEQESRLDGQEGRLDGQEERLDEQEGRLDGQESRLDEHTERLDEHTERLDGHDARLDDLEAAVESIRDGGGHSPTGEE